MRIIQRTKAQQWLAERHTPNVVERVMRLNAEFVEGYMLRGLHPKKSPGQHWLWTGHKYTTREWRKQRRLHARPFNRR